MAKPITAAPAAQMHVRFGLAKETPGALRYQELDDRGDVIENVADGLCGGLYLRKAKVTGTPNFLAVTIQPE